MLEIFKIVRYKLSINAMKEVISVVNDGKIAEGLSRFEKLSLNYQEVIRSNLKNALNDCVHFLDATNNYRGDNKTLTRITGLIYTYPFAKQIGISVEKLDGLAAKQGSFSSDTLKSTLNSLLQNEEKTVNVSRVINRLEPTHSATLSPPGIPKVTLIPS
jgi:hypothetical protein